MVVDCHHAGRLVPTEGGPGRLSAVEEVVSSAWGCTRLSRPTATRPMARGWLGSPPAPPRPCCGPAPAAPGGPN